LCKGYGEIRDSLPGFDIDPLCFSEVIVDTKGGIGKTKIIDFCPLAGRTQVRC